MAAERDGQARSSSLQSLFASPAPDASNQGNKMRQHEEPLSKGIAQGGHLDPRSGSDLEAYLERTIETFKQEQAQRLEQEVVQPMKQAFTIYMESQNKRVELEWQNREDKIHNFYEERIRQNSVRYSNHAAVLRNRIRELEANEPHEHLQKTSDDSKSVTGQKRRGELPLSMPAPTRTKIANDVHSHENLSREEMSKRGKDQDLGGSKDYDHLSGQLYFRPPTLEPFLGRSSNLEVEKHPLALNPRQSSRRSTPSPSISPVPIQSPNKPTEASTETDFIRIPVAILEKDYKKKGSYEWSPNHPPNKLIHALHDAFYGFIIGLPQREMYYKTWLRSPQGCALSYIIGKKKNFKDRGALSMSACTKCTKQGRPCVVLLEIDGLQRLGFRQAVSGETAYAVGEPGFYLPDGC